MGDRDDNEVNNRTAVAEAPSPLRSLTSLSIVKLLREGDRRSLRRGTQFMKTTGLAPERVTIMMTANGTYVLKFICRCDPHPFVAYYSTFRRLLQSLSLLGNWKLKLIEFFNMAFDVQDVPYIDKSMQRVAVHLVLLRNCTYPGVQPGPESVQFLSAINRRKRTIVCEYGEDRLKNRIRADHVITPAQMPSAVPQFDYADVDQDMSVNDPSGTPPPPPPAPSFDDDSDEPSGVS